MIRQLSVYREHRFVYGILPAQKWQRLSATSGHFESLREKTMTCFATEGKRNQCRTDRTVETNGWKKTVSETLCALHIIPDKFNGKVVVTFKDGGISYLEKTETLK